MVFGLGLRALGAGAVTAGEYFLDTDPGPGNAVAFAAEDGAFDQVTEGALPIQLPPDSLTPGLHRIGFRFRDEAGQWGNSLFLDLRVESAANLALDPPLTNSLAGGFSATPLMGAEYTLITSNAPSALANDGAFDSISENLLPAELALSGLTTGLYRVGIRFQDGAGNWGNPAYVDFRVEDAAALALDPFTTNGLSAGMPAVPLVAAEMRVGGVTLPLSAADGTFDHLAEELQAQALAISALATGFHRAEVRFQDATGVWGNLAYVDFRVEDAAALALDPFTTNGLSAGMPAVPLVAAEMRVGGTTLPLSAADGTFDHLAEELQAQALAISALAMGFHRAEVRFQDATGVWGNAAYVDFRVEDSGALPLEPPFSTWPSATGPHGLAAADLRIDQGASLPLAAADGAFDSVHEGFLPQTVDPAELTPGLHRLAIRAQDSAGEWGNACLVDVRVVESTALALDPFTTNGLNAGRSAVPLVAAEMRVGGVTLPLSAADGTFDHLAEELQAQALAISALATGFHRAEVRFQDATGAWGSLVYADFRVEDSGALAVEPFLTNGFNSGASALPVAAAELRVGGAVLAFDAEDGTFDAVTEGLRPQALAISGLATGFHRAEVRFQDAAGVWGSPVYQDFRVEDAATLVLASPMANGTNGQGVWRSLRAAEYFVDETVPPGTGQSLAAWDGTFDSVAEELAASVVPLGTLAGGFHRIGLRFQDDGGNWGGEVYQGFRVYSLEPEAPSIVLQPADVTVDLGRAFALTVVANGDGPLAYRWFRNGLALTGATNETYSVAIAQLTNSGSYTAVISNGVGSITSRVALVSVATPPPVITCPTNQVLACAGPGTPVTFTASAVDSLGAVLPVTCSPASGTPFPVGRTPVTCSATDSLGASNRCTFQITVEDRGAPTLQCPGTIQVAVTTGACGAVVDYAAQGVSATDTCSAVVLSCLPPTGSEFPLGSQAVTCTAMDGASNSTQCTFTVNVSIRPQAPVATVIYPQRDGQTLSNQAQVCLTTTFPNGSIYFTEDGSTPGLASRRYTNCVDLFYEGVFPDQQVMTLQAIAVSSNGLETAMGCPVTVVLAPFCDGNFKLLAKAANDGGGEVRKNPVREKYPCDVVVRAEAYPAAGWTFMGWLGDTTGTNAVTPVVLTRDKCVEGVFGTVLRTNVQGNGTVRVTPAAPLYPYGSQVSIFALPAPGYYFSHWTNLLGVDITPSGRTANPFRQRIADALPSLTAVFLPLPLGQNTLTVLVEGMGSVNVSPFSNRYPASMVVTNRATPAAGQLFLGWSGDAAGTNNPLLVTMDQSRVITGRFTSAPRLEFYRCEGKLARDAAQLVMKGDLGGVFQLERAENLGLPLLWQPLGTFTNTLGWAQYDDPFQPSARQRYYRLRLVP